MLRALFLSAIFSVGFAATGVAQIRVIDGLGREAPAGGVSAWSHLQATGEPNTSAAGDFRTAWASATPDASDEWLELVYEKEITIKEVHVYETYNTGALFKITGYKKSDMEVPLWSGDDPTPIGAGKGISKIKLKSPLKTKRIRIHLHSKEVTGWNEIDAVGVVDTEGAIHWAVDASASSTYGSAAPDARDDEINKLKAALKTLEAETAALKLENQRLKDLLKQE